MATPRKKIEATGSRTATRTQAGRRADAAPGTGAERELSLEEISRRAFEIWERNGRRPGRDLENWLEAEAELRGSAGHPA
jgi:hypothetical protein